VFNFHPLGPLFWSRSTPHRRSIVPLQWASLDKVQPIVMLINGDREIGKIAQAMEKVGKEGVVTVSVSNLSNLLSHEMC